MKEDDENKLPHYKKLYKAIQDDEFLTDDEMKGLDKYVTSDIDSDADPLLIEAQ